MLSYLVNVEKTKVYPDSLVYYKGQRYSVSPKYIGQSVQIKQTENILYIYHNKHLIATHEVEDKVFDYTKEHYKECLQICMPYKDDKQIDELATNNLKLLDKLLVTQNTR
jgi:hypothetical protein